MYGATHVSNVARRMLNVAFPQRRTVELLHLLLTTDSNITASTTQCLQHFQKRTVCDLHFPFMIDKTHRLMQVRSCMLHTIIAVQSHIAAIEGSEVLGEHIGRLM